MTDYYPTSYAAEYLKMNPKSLNSARRNGKLEGKKIKGRWFYSLLTLTKYKNQRWYRHPEVKNGELTIPEVVKIFNVNPQQVYYFLYSKKIPFEKRLNRIIIKEINLIELKRKTTTKKHK